MSTAQTPNNTVVIVDSNGRLVARFDSLAAGLTWVANWAEGRFGVFVSIVPRCADETVFRIQLGQ